MPKVPEGENPRILEKLMGDPKFREEAEKLKKKLYPDLPSDEEFMQSLESDPRFLKTLKESSQREALIVRLMKRYPELERTLIESVVDGAFEAIPEDFGQQDEEAET